MLISFLIFLAYFNGELKEVSKYSNKLKDNNCFYDQVFIDALSRIFIQYQIKEAVFILFLMELSHKTIILKIAYLFLVQAPKEEPVTYPQQNGQILKLKNVHLKETLHQREVDPCVYSIPIFQLKSATF